MDLGLVVTSIIDLLVSAGGLTLAGAGRQMHGDLERMYGSLPKSMYTLFAAVSQGFSWDVTLLPLKDLHMFYSAALLIYISLVLFGVSNVVTSVFVESAIMSAQHYRDLIVQQKETEREIAVAHMKE